MKTKLCVICQKYGETDYMEGCMHYFADQSFIEKCMRDAWTLEDLLWENIDKLQGGW